MDRERGGGEGEGGTRERRERRKEISGVTLEEGTCRGKGQGEGD